VALGWALSEGGRLEEGIAEMRMGIAGWRSAGSELPVSYFQSILADTLRRAGRTQEGLDLVAEGLESSYRSEEAWWRAEMLRVRAELLQALPRQNAHAAERQLREAIRVAAAQNARSLELRAATSLSRLMRCPGLSKCSWRGSLMADTRVSTKGTNEQQDQVDQPSLVRLPQRNELHRRHISLLCAPSPPGRTLITLFG